MAESAVNFLFEKLSAQLIEEASLLGGIKGEVEELKLELDSMRAFLREADRRKNSNEGVRTWVGQIRDTVHDVEDIIDEYIYLMDRPRRGGLRGYLLDTIRLPKNIYYKHQLATLLQETKVKIHNISERRIRYGLNQIDEGTSPYDAGERWLRDVETSLSLEDDEIVGMKKEIDLLVRWLVEEDQQRTVISVTGMAGLGKTTLVTKAFKHPQVKKHFNCYACVSVSQTLRINELLGSIVKQLLEAKHEMVPNELAAMDSSDLRQMIRQNLQSTKYVIILDDIWSINDWEKLSCVFPDCRCGSRLMVTTRDVGVANAVGGGRFTCKLQPLNQEEAWELFCKKAFLYQPCPPELQPLARTIVEKCEGLPLAILAMGGLLMTKENNVVEWNSILERLNWELRHNAMLQSLNNILLLSFYHLPYYLKRCFLYCAMFPEDYVIKRKWLIRLRVAEGFVTEGGSITMEEMAENYLKELIHRNMLQVIQFNRFGRVKACRMHDVMREVALSLSSEEEFSMIYDDGQGVKKLSKVCRMSINKSEEIIQSPTSLSRLRTILVFDRNMPSSSSSFLHTMASSFKLLRVLNLQGVPIKSLPNELMNLFNLRYLNLRATEIRELPKSLERLRNLQTLDVRNTKMESLPSGIVKLQKLRHLFVYRIHDFTYKSFNYHSVIKVPAGICNITGLQTLRNIGAEDGSMVGRVGNLTQLRRLAISKVRTTDGEKLCNSIRRMKQLRRLVLFAASEEELLELEALSPHPPPLIQHLALIGRLEKLPQWLSSLTHLTDLRLFWSQLSEEEDLLSSLQSLPNLLLLSLRKAYQCHLLRCQDGWFPKLKTLYLGDFTQLSQLVIEQGAMPCIQKLSLVRCKELKMVPQGIEYLTDLQELYLREMPMELVGRVARLKDDNEDRQKVCHICYIEHIFQGEEGEWCSEQLN